MGELKGHWCCQVPHFLFRDKCLCVHVSRPFDVVLSPGSYVFFCFIFFLFRIVMKKAGECFGVRVNRFRSVYGLRRLEEVLA